MPRTEDLFDKDEKKVLDFFDKHKDKCYTANEIEHQVFGSKDREHVETIAKKRTLEILDKLERDKYITKKYCKW